MFYRMTRLHFDEDRFDELRDWAHSVRPRLESLGGLLFADLVRGAPGKA